jgi:hypothetical protein
MVGNIVNALAARGELKNTAIIFTADNGLFHGEHRVRSGKVRHYEESSRVPLIIRGPGVPRNKTRKQLAANIDLAPTILDFANGKARRKIDGRTLLPVMEENRFHPGRGILIEAFNNADVSDPDAVDIRYSAVRTNEFVYAETGAEVELYDLSADPFELTSRHGDPAYAAIRARLDRLLAQLTACAGKGCGAKPAVKLKLGFKTSGGCVSSGVGVKTKGADAGGIEQGRLYINGRIAGKHTGGTSRLTLGHLSSKRKNRVEVLFTSLDGRRATVKKTIPAAC